MSWYLSHYSLLTLSLFALLWLDVQPCVFFTRENLLFLSSERTNKRLRERNLLAGWLSAFMLDWFWWCCLTVEGPICLISDHIAPAFLLHVVCHITVLPITEYLFSFFFSTAHILTVYLQPLPPHTAYLGQGWVHPPQPNVPAWAEAPLSAALFMVVSSGSAGCLCMPHQPPPLCPAMPAHCPTPAPAPPQTSSANSPPSLHAGKARQQTTGRACTWQNVIFKYILSHSLPSDRPAHELSAFCAYTQWNLKSTVLEDCQVPVLLDRQVDEFTSVHKLL